MLSINKHDSKLNKGVLFVPLRMNVVKDNSVLKKVFSELENNYALNRVGVREAK